ncbi:MAG TPA: zinc ribbon domain-containing protein, partial [Ktedonobacteraceae bacterium]|nr:zinc ribbon domain-containing protein [Ktedonobacteraceae bacterium]
MFYCPRCKAKVPLEALYCTRCGFNATNARLHVLTNTIDKSNGLEKSQPGTLASSSSIASSAGQSLPVASSVLPPPMAQIPETPPVSTKEQINPPVPARPLPSHVQQPTQTHITPAHLMAIPQPPSAPAAPMYPQVQQYAPMQGPWNHTQTAAALPLKHFQGQPVDQRQTEPTRTVTSQATRGTESFVATRNAAERWRTSWRNKQRSEAGPATGVSRGQSSVPEPLMAMQHSLARIRAIVKPQPEKKHFSVFWVSIVLMACLIIGLATFILSTYTGNTGTGNTVSSPHTFPPPSLSVSGPQSLTIQAGQSLHIHGNNFAVGDPILFLFDGANSISGTDGKEIALQVSNQGTFDVNIPVATSW